jgi:S-adenosylmethionine-diacylgycerolhomoserine-N-methlytransferase
MSPGVLVDARILWRLVCGKPGRGSHAENLQAFYGPQADGYDAFRARLLHGRPEMLAALDVKPGQVVVDLGCGTGSNLDILADRADSADRLILVDLCPALLAKARARASGRPNVMLLEGDAARWSPPTIADRVILSYALTMMPDWQKVIGNAKRMLKPGGRIGVVDFYLPDGANRIESLFWRKWFAHDGVELSSLRLAELRREFPQHHCFEMRGTVPYLPGLRVPYFYFVGVRS